MITSHASQSRDGKLTLPAPQPVDLIQVGGSLSAVDGPVAGKSTTIDQDLLRDPWD